MSTLALLMMQSDSTNTAGNAAATAGAGIFGVIWLVVVVLMIAALWKVFVKAGEPGWAAIVPIYNYIVLDRIAGRPTWWIILWFFIFPIPYIVTALDIAKRFGKSTGFALGLIFLPFVFYPILAWGDAAYTGTPVMA